ncbi:MAG: hypothetical protein AB1405_09955 [Bdellovibrionota bacterium]
MQFRWIACFALVVAGVLASCGTDGPGSVTQVIGPAGGTITLGSLSLSIPAGALSEDTEITITAGGAAPDYFTPVSPVFIFEPQGLTFAIPATATLPFNGQPEHPEIIWSNEAGDGFLTLPSDDSETTVSALITHFSTGFVVDAAFWLGEARVNDGGGYEIELQDIAPPGGSCDFSGPVAVLTIQVFGSNGVPFLTSQDVAVIGVDSVFILEHSNDPDADFYSGPELILDTSTGITVINTGSEGTSYVGISLAEGTEIDTGTQSSLAISYISVRGGDGYEANVTLICDPE